MFRDRTNLYLSYRQSAGHLPPSYRFNSSEESAPMLSEENDNNNNTGGIEMSTLPPRWTDVSDEVNDILEHVEKDSETLEKLHQKHSLPGFDDRSAEEKEIDTLTFNITRGFQECQTLIKRLDNESKQQANMNNQADARLLANARLSLAAKVQEASSRFRNKQSQYLKALRRGTSTDLGELESGDYAGYDSHQQQQQLMMQDSSNEQAIHQRESEINKIAQGILEISAIFKELSTMVIDQGTLLDRIDYNIESMQFHVKDADQQLTKASHHQKHTAKCKLILFLVLLVAFFFILVVTKPRH